MYSIDGECRSCGENPEKVYRCQSCGTPEPLDGDQNDDESNDAELMTDGGHVICGDCGRHVEPDWSYCPHCGEITREALQEMLAKGAGAGHGVVAEDIQVGGIAATYQGPGPIDGGGE